MNEIVNYELKGILKTSFIYNLSLAVHITLNTVIGLRTRTGKDLQITTTRQSYFFSVPFSSTFFLLNVINAGNSNLTPFLIATFGGSLLSGN